MTAKRMFKLTGLLLGAVTTSVLGQFPPVIELETLAPEEGRTVEGQFADTFLGWSAAGGGDFNDDGVADFLVGAPGPLLWPPPLPPNMAYVFFGGPDLLPDPDILLGGLDGSNGFVIPGLGLLHMMGVDVDNARDINADGIDDLIVGARSAGPETAGQAYVLFGRPALGGTGEFDVSALDGTNGFRVDGLATGDALGISVAGLGDLNGDAFRDIAIGALGGDPHGLATAGQTHVVFGGPFVGASGVIDPGTFTGKAGFTVNGIAPGDSSGSFVSAAGDVNADGYDDMLVSAPWALPQGQFEAGQAYVIFGDPEIGGGGVLELADLDGSNGFRIDGLGYMEHGPLVTVAGVGDVNNDGINDIGLSASTEVYVIFGRPALGSSGSFDLTTLDGSNGFLVPVPRDLCYPSSRLDINQDRIDDLVIGQPLRTGDRVYVFFGEAGLGSAGSLDINSLDGTNGFIVNGLLYAHTGRAVAGVGDVNDDGVEDLVIGSPTRSYSGGGPQNVGRFDVLFGRRRFPLGDFDQDGDVDLDDFGIFAACYNGAARPPAATCPPGVDADLDTDGDCDLDDFAIFAANYTGSL